MSELPPGFPKAGEDRLLLEWWRSRGETGRLVLEVKIGLWGPGGWPAKKNHKRLDGLHIPSAPSGIVHWDHADHDEFAELVADEPVNLLESKDSLNVDVIGQAEAGIDMFSRAYPSCGRIAPIVTVWDPTNPALTWVCHKRGIEVFAPARPAT
jgi:hypothetical protein